MRQENLKEKIKKLRGEIQITDLIPFIGIVVVLIFFTIVSRGKLLQHKGIISIFNEAFTLAIGSAGALFLMAEGNIDLSLSGVVGLAGAVAAKAGIISPWLVLPVAMIVGGFLGTISGFLVAKIKIQSFIATLAMSFMCEGLVIFILDQGAQAAPRAIYTFDKVGFKIPIIIIYLLILFVLYSFTPFGKACRAIGSKEEVSLQAGINVDKMRIIAFAICGLACGVSAFFSLARSGTASTSTGHNYNFDVLLTLMLGGLPITGGWNAKYKSAVIGALTMAIIKTGLVMWGLDAFVQQIVKGVIFILAVAVSFDRKNVKIIQ